MCEVRNIYKILVGNPRLRELGVKM